MELAHSILKTQWAGIRSLIIKVAKGIDHYRCGYSKVKFRAELAIRMNDSPVVVFGIVIPSEFVEDFCTLKKMEWEVAMSYSRLVKLVMCKFWNPKEFSTYLDANDVMQEGLLAVLDAIYGYCGKNKMGKPVKFITYAQKVIKRRLGRVLNRTLTNHLHRPNYMVDLIGKYEQTKQAMNGPVIFEEVVALMGLRPRTRQRLADALVNVEHSEEESLEQLTMPDPREKLDSEERSKLAGIMAQLTPFQLAVLEGCQNGGYGWQAKVAARFINPKTGKSYSRRAPNVVLQQIQRLLEVA